MSNTINQHRQLVMPSSIQVLPPTYTQATAHDSTEIHSLTVPSLSHNIYNKMNLAAAQRIQPALTQRRREVRCILQQLQWGRGNDYIRKELKSECLTIDVILIGFNVRVLCEPK